MRNYQRPGLSQALIVSIVLLAGAASAGFAQAMSPLTTLNGTIVSFDGSSITLVLSDDSTRTVMIDPSTLILSRQPVAPAEIKAGDALGVAARRLADGSLIATSVNIFSPELWARAGKGQWPMSDGQVMTNAMATSVVTSVQNRVLTMKYAGVVATISLPDGAQIHRIVTVKPEALKAGLRVAIRGTLQENGNVLASSVSFDQAAG